MIAGLDSSYDRPTQAIATSARAAGVSLWSGYLATRPNVGLAAPWPRADFDAARLCGATPVAFCSGYDDPSGCASLAAAWDVRLCLDVEAGGLRGDGSWVQGWLDASGAGLYGNAPVHAARQAAFHVLAAYPGYDPGDTWPGYLRRPSVPCGWQWMGSHTEFGLSVDRGWYDDWFLGGNVDLTVEQAQMLQELHDAFFGGATPVRVEQTLNLLLTGDPGSVAYPSDLRQSWLATRLAALTTPTVDVAALASALATLLAPHVQVLDEAQLVADLTAKLPPVVAHEVLQAISRTTAAG